ncbi:hypothetical protein [Achromobacter aloeverae]|uniref:hypothetical protein n=1 Tax=Achromobacter aloeverae TaxID=1750518 RepID=UPI001301424A|nr:hypothetical protein [Achromobacter aloeverae]
MKPHSHRSPQLARCHAALLAWAVLMLVLTPVGATLHAITHLGAAPLRVLAAASGVLGASPGVQAAIPAALDPATDGKGDEDGRGADAHCHTCDEWQVLDHVLTPAPLLALPPPTFLPHIDHAQRPVLLARAPWILPRAPPPVRALPASA